jgi:peptidoglycan/LPS O-acetylase OafA/YrhL
MSGQKAARAGGERFLALDSLRGLLASTVVIYHLPSQGWLWTLSYIRNGMLAVTFFFVLSGFVIGTTYGERLAKGFPVSRFLGLRLGRIYPLHVFMIAVIAVWQFTRLAFHIGAVRDGAPFTGLFDPGLLPFNFLLLQKFGWILGWNDPSWSIGVEWWTYVTFAVVAALITIRRSTLLTAIVLILPWIALRISHQSLGVGGDATIDCLMNFGLGLIVCDARSWPVWRLTDKIGRNGATLIEMVAIAIGLWMIAHFGGKLSPLIAPTFAFMIAVFCLERGWISRVLVTAPMLLIGELSYSIYMIHHFILDRMIDLVWAYGAALHLPISITATGRTVLVGNAVACDLFSLFLLAIVIGLSTLSFRYVEKPARLWSRRMLNPSHSEKVTPRDPTAAF